MRQKTSVEIFNYWDRIRGSADAPLRNSIEPASIRHVLPNLFILELQQDGEIRFRLAGTAVCNLFGRELRDDLFTSLWSDHQATGIAEIAGGVMSNAVPVLLNVTGYGLNTRVLGLEMVLMPVRSKEDQCDRILGCLAPAAATPWTISEPLQSLSMERSRLMQDWGAAKTIAPLDARLSKSVYVSPESSLRGTFRRALHLRVFEGDRVD